MLQWRRSSIAQPGWRGDHESLSERAFRLWTTTTGSRSGSWTTTALPISSPDRMAGVPHRGPEVSSIRKKEIRDYTCNAHQQGPASARPLGNSTGQVPAKDPTVDGYLMKALTATYTMRQSNPIWIIGISTESKLPEWPAHGNFFPSGSLFTASTPLLVSSSPDGLNMSSVGTPSTAYLEGSAFVMSLRSGGTAFHGIRAKYSCTFHVLCTSSPRLPETLTSSARTPTHHSSIPPPNRRAKKGTHLKLISAAVQAHVYDLKFGFGAVELVVDAHQLWGKQLARSTPVSRKVKGYVLSSAYRCWNLLLSMAHSSSNQAFEPVFPRRFVAHVDGSSTARCRTCPAPRKGTRVHVNRTQRRHSINAYDRASVRRLQCRREKATTPNSQGGLQAASRQMMAHRSIKPNHSKERMCAGVCFGPTGTWLQPRRPRA